MFYFSFWMLKIGFQTKSNNFMTKSGNNRDQWVKNETLETKVGDLLETILAAETFVKY